MSNLLSKGQTVNIVPETIKIGKPHKGDPGGFFGNSNYDKKPTPMWKKLIVSHSIFLLSGAVAANISMANHPEWTPCCATLSQSEIAKNLKNAELEVKKDQAIFA